MSGPDRSNQYSASDRIVKFRTLCTSIPAPNRSMSGKHGSQRQRHLRRDIILGDSPSQPSPERNIGHILNRTIYSRKCAIALNFQPLHRGVFAPLSGGARSRSIKPLCGRMYSGGRSRKIYGDEASEGLSNRPPSRPLAGCLGHRVTREAANARGCRGIG